MILLSQIVAFTLGLVALLHFYWSFGGVYGLASAVPTLIDNNEFTPSKPLTFIVACLITFLAYIATILVADNPPFKTLLPYLGYAIAFVFVVRSIGDFKYVGFFKKVYNSSFAKKDTLFFSPLCLLLGLSFFVLSKYSSGA